MYLKVKLKNELISRDMLIIIFISLLFSFSVNLLYKSLENRGNYYVKIEDEDKTELSAEFVNIISEIKEVKISEKDEDVRYIIKEGFGEKFHNGELSGLIEVNKLSFKSGINLLNDRIATKLATHYIYRNLYERMSKESGISFEEYQAKLSETQLLNEIFVLNINNENILKGMAKQTDYSGYLKLFFIISVGMYISIKAFEELRAMRVSGLSDRLRLSGKGELNLFVSHIAAASLKFFVFLISAFLMTFTEIKIYNISMILFYISAIMLYILGRLVRDETAFAIISKIMWILFVIFGMLIKFAG